MVDMIDVVSGDHADDVLDGFLSTLGMLAVVLPLIGGKRLEGRLERRELARLTEKARLRVLERSGIARRAERGERARDDAVEVQPAS